MRARDRLLTVVAALAATVVTAAPAAAVQPRLVFERSIGSAAVPGAFVRPFSTAVDSAGNLYVDDFGNNRIQKLSPSGDVLAVFPNATGDPLYQPTGVAVDAVGNVYVADHRMPRIQKYAPDGHYLATIGNPGSGNGQLSNPTAVAVGASGNVYVADTDGRVQKFAPDGTWQATWGGAPAKPFGVPWGLAVDDQENVYVADTFGGRIQKLTSSGMPVATFDAGGQLCWPRQLTVDHDGSIYAAEQCGDEATKLSSSGQVLATFGPDLAGFTPGRLSGPSGVSVDGSGAVYVADTENHLVHKFSQTGERLTTFGHRDAVPDPRGVAVEAGGNLLVMSFNAGAVSRFAPDGTPLARWGSRGLGPGQFQNPYGITRDTSGDVYVADTENNRVQRLSADGAHELTIGGYGTGPGQFREPQDVAIAPDGSIYVADTANDRVQRFAADGTYLSTLGGTGDGPGQFQFPRGVAVDGDGNVYVSDFNFPSSFPRDETEGRVQKFTPSGELVAAWGAPGSATAGLTRPSGIAIGGDGAVYVTVLNGVRKFSATGGLLASWRNIFSDLPQFIAVDGDALYVSDNGGHRVAKLRELPPTPTTTDLTTDHPAGSVYGDRVTFTVTVTPDDAGSASPGLLGAAHVERETAGGWVPFGSCIAGQFVMTCQTTTLPAGTQTLRATFAGKDNAGDASWEPSQSAPLDVTVAKRPATVAGANASRVYGDANPALGGTLAGFLAGDGIGVTWTTSADQHSPAGTYDVVGSLTDPKGMLGNYDVTTRPGTLTVRRRPLHAVATDATQVYGHPEPLTGSLTAADIVAGDDITARDWVNEDGERAGVGDHAIVPVLDDPGDRLANYELMPSGTITVTPAELLLEGDHQSRPYGDANPALTGRITDGLVAGDDVTAEWSTTATKSSPVGTYRTTATLSGAGAHNYEATVTPGALEVSPRPLSAVPNDVSRPYGEDNPPLDGVLTGTADGDDVTATYATTATPASKPGTYPITATVHGSDSVLANYDVTTVDGTFTVTDEHGPTITVPGAITAEATGPSGAAVSFDVTAVDDAVDDPTISCDHDSGATFPFGKTTVSCEASDGVNTTTDSFTIEVVDTTAPALDLPAPVARATSKDGAIVTYTATATDKVDGPVGITCTPLSGTRFPIGTTTVACTATDAAGNTARGTFPIQVRKLTADEISADMLATVHDSAAYQSQAPGEQQRLDALLQTAIRSIARIEDAQSKALATLSAQRAVQALVRPGGLTQAQADRINGLLDLL